MAVNLGDRAKVEVEQIDLVAAGLDPAPASGDVGDVRPEPVG